jgi:hypothetical protein
VLGLLGKLGKLVLAGVSKLGGLAKKSTGSALLRVSGALGRIGQRLGEFVEQLGSQMRGKGAAGAASEGAHAAEQAARQGAKKTGQEAAEEAGEKGVKEAAGEAGENTRKKAGDSPHTTEKTRVAALAGVEAKVLDERGVPTAAIVQTLKATFQPRYKWIKDFVADSLGGLRYEINLIASKIPVGKTDDSDVGKKAKSKLAEEIPAQEGFATWFDSLTRDEFENYWLDKSARNVIERRIRHPGGYHEWLKVSQVLKLKEWGVPFSKIQTARTLTKQTSGVNFKHGVEGSGTMHKQLDEMFESSTSFDEFLEKLNRWADVELTKGRQDLPVELQRP